MSSVVCWLGMSLTLGLPQLIEPGYPHRGFSAQESHEGPRSYWLFEPTEPRPETAPVVVFIHGWLAVNPGVYGAWIEHLCRSGKVVIYPRYQGDSWTRPAEFLPNAARGGERRPQSAPRSARPPAAATRRLRRNRPLGGGQSRGGDGGDRRRLGPASVPGRGLDMPG